MRSGRPHRVVLRGATLTVLVLLAGVPTGCGSDAPLDAGAPAPGSGAASAAPTQGATSSPALPVPAEIVPALQGLLDRRAAALLARDAPAFARTVAEDPALSVVQGGYFDNLVQLPIADLAFRLVPETLLRDDGTGVPGYWASVEVRLTLDGVDAIPTMSATRMRFVRERGRWVVLRFRDPSWDARTGVRPEPWEIEPIRVREAPGVLLVTDAATPDVESLLRGVTEGLADIGARVPAALASVPDRVVVYALTDPRFLAGFEGIAGVPGGETTVIDALAYGARGDGAALASTRIVLAPTALQQPAFVRDRLVRHELTHVVLARVAEQAAQAGAPVPLWLNEGLAEWLSVQALPPARRLVDPTALAAVQDARAAGTLTMPPGRSFNDDAAAEHYLLSWWVCEWLAATYGDSAPWTVLSSVLDATTTDPEATDRQVVRDLLDLDLDRVARSGADLLAATYAPTTDPGTDPTTDPDTDPGAGTTSDG